MSILSSKESKSKDIRTNKVENELRQQCLQYRVQYVDREKDESRYKCRKRRKLMRENIQNAHASSKIIKNMESNGDDVDLLLLSFWIWREILFVFLPWQIKMK